MKIFKLITCIILISACSTFAQTTPQTAPQTATPATAPAKTVQPATAPGSTPANPAKPIPMASPAGTGTQNVAGQPPMTAMQPGVRMNRYMVRIPHTKEQCATVTKEMQEKGAPMMMRFDWACAAGEHVGYAIMPGQNEEALIKMLPEGVQKLAKVTKVDKLSNAQMEQMHK